MLPYRVYRLTSPSGRWYIGHTKQAIQERWRQHVQTALSGRRKTALYDAIKKYGPESFRVELVEDYPTIEEAMMREVIEIEQGRVCGRIYNLSAGGEDYRSGLKILRELMSDPLWMMEYRKRLSEGCKASPAHQKRLADMTAQAAAWRAENPDRAKEISRRNALIAAEKARGVKRGPRDWVPPAEWREKMGVSQRRRWEKATPEEREKKSHTSRRAAADVWARRTDCERAAIGQAISERLKEANALLTPDEKAAREAQLAAARKNIDHDLRKRRQREALAAYWTPERRAEASAKRRKRGLTPTT